MENASKAIIMAGGVLLTIAMVSLLYLHGIDFQIIIEVMMI